MSADYSSDHASASADTAAAGAAVTFTLSGQGTYDPPTDTTTPGADLVVTGSAVEVKGSLFKYQALGLEVAKARTLFFVPDTLGQAPSLDSLVLWGGETYAVKNVQPIAPAGDILAAHVVVSL